VRRLAIVIALVLAPSAQAADHLMHVNEVSVSPADVNRQFVEFLDPGEPFPESTYSLAIQNSSGAIVQEQTFNQPHGFALRSDPYVVGKPGVAGADQALTLTIPNAPGKACFHRGSPAASAPVIHCLEYGSTRPGCSAQLQPSESVAFAAPTPGARNAAGTAACGSPGGGGVGTTGDKRKPKTTLSGKKIQDVDKLAVTARLDEDGTVSATGTVRVPNSSKVYRFKKATKSARSGRKVKLRLRLSRKAKVAVKRALGSGHKLKAKVKVTAADKAKNRTTKKRSIRLRS